MQCKNCGAQISLEDIFCPNCGSDQRGESFSTVKETVDRSKSAKTDNNKMGLITAILAAICALMLCSVAVYALYAAGIIGAEKESETDITVTAVDKPKETEAAAAETAQENNSDMATAVIGTVVEPPKPPQFSLGSYSSEHRASSDGVSSDTYYASHIIDGDPKTAWIPVCEDDGLTPIGHWLELTASSPQSVSGLNVVNGFAKDSRKYFNNYRVKDIKIIINGIEEIYAQLSDLGCGTEEYISFGKTYQASSLRIVIMSVHETNPTYKEAAISEITPV